MGKKVDRVCRALKQGLSDGLASHQLNLFVTHTCPSASSNQIKRDSLMTMADPDLHDKSPLEFIYGIAIDRGLRATA